jgi:hypothetical protein
MEDPTRPSPWVGFAFDATIIASLTTLTVTHALPVMVFVALVGPMIGSRLALRHVRDGGPPHSGAGGSAALALLLAVGSLVRRSVGLT